MKTRVIFGGSFDPVTKAHVDMTKKLAERFDEVIVVPAYVSPFKPDGAELSGNERLDMLKAELDGIKNVFISDTELLSQGASYSYLTAQKLSENGVRLYFAIGSDGLSLLDKWARPDLLKKLVTFYVVERPYFTIDERELEKARSLYDVEIAPFVGEEGSSALLKAAVAFNRASEIVPRRTAELIEEKKLYRDYCYVTEKFELFKMKESRREHTYRVAKSAIILAKKANVAVDKAVKAALMHDVAKYLSEEELSSLGVTDFGRELPASCRHQITGAQLAEIVYGERDDDILAAIRTHTTGAEEMSTLQKIIFAADYIEDGRDFDEIARIREITYFDLEKGMAAILENTINYLSKNGMKIASVTKKLYEKYRSEE